MASAEFAYVVINDKSYPVIPLHIRNKNGERDLEALVDSGALMSTFGAEVANKLGVKIENGERRISIGTAGKIEVFIHEVEIKVFDKWFPCKVAFSKELRTKFNLLGREGFFDQHLVTFNQKDKKIILTEF